jgi:2-phosphoglycerate kinase
MSKPVQIRKYSGDTVEFDRDKLIASLTSAGSGVELADEITQEVEKRLFDGISTSTIYQMAFKRLKKSRRTSASKYKIKKAIMELGPSGFPFEQFIGHIFNNDGYSTEIGVVI